MRVCVCVCVCVCPHTYTHAHDTYPHTNINHIHKYMHNLSHIPVSPLPALVAPYAGPQ